MDLPPLSGDDARLELLDEDARTLAMAGFFEGGDFSTESSRLCDEACISSRYLIS